MTWRRPRILFPLIVGGLSLIQLASIQSRWADCAQFVCFHYPAYLRLGQWQAMDINVVPLFIATAFQFEPKSLATIGAYHDAIDSPLPFAVLLIGYWFVVGCWWERLQRGTRVSGLWRKLLLIPFAFFAFLSVSMLIGGTRSGYEGPLFTLAVLLPLVMMNGMAAAELQLAPFLRKGWRAEALVFIAAAGTSFWAYTAAASELAKQRSADDFLVSLIFSPKVIDAFMFHWVGFVATGILQALQLKALAVPLGATASGASWAALLYTARGSARMDHSWRKRLVSVGPWLIRAGIALAILTMFTSGAHGPTGALGFATAITLSGYGLCRASARAS